MANKTLFPNARLAAIPRTDTVNRENAPAYALEPKHALAQYAATGCFSNTYYATAEEQLDQVLALCGRVEPAFVARVAIHSRTRSYMKDMPALLCAWLSTRDARLHESVFGRVIDNTRMLRNYVQILRSGAVGRRSLGSAPKRLVREWLARQSVEALFTGSVGQSPSLTDIVKMVHPKPNERTREAFYGYLLGRPHDVDALPELVSQYERFKKGQWASLPDLPFTMLSSLPLERRHWLEIARNASWQTTRMNLNTFARHGVFDDKHLTRQIAGRLRNAAEIARARVFPYQLLAAFQNCSGVPSCVRNALQDAMQTAIANVPKIEGRVVVCPDVSGSMASPVTGHRAGSATAVRCIDVAALVAAAMVRKNPSAIIVPFEQDVVPLKMSAGDRIMSNAAKLASIGGGGTDCSAALKHLDRRDVKADLVLFVSDNESWMDARGRRGTALMNEWERFKSRNRRARLVCLDVQPNATTQAIERADILNIGGFSDPVFEVIAEFAAGGLEPGHWVERIEAIAA